MIIDNLSTIGEIMQEQVDQLLREARDKDEQIAKLKEEVGNLKGREESKVTFIQMFQEMKHTHNQPCHQDEKE